MGFVLVLITLISLVSANVVNVDPAKDENFDDFDGRGENPPPTQMEKKEWWKNAVLYQIYPRSFKDSNNDGVGDLKGIIEKFGHLHELGVDAVWISPIFKSPMVDFGYDIEDYLQVDPIFGTNDDLDRLILEAKRYGIKLLLDFVPNHTSNKHNWFIRSENREPGYEDYYVWVDRKNVESGEDDYPNNWRSNFGGRAWTWSSKREQYYLHQFSQQQPDLNFRNPRVLAEFQYILRYYYEKGIDGFRIDAINYAVEDEGFPDDPLNPGGDKDNFDDYNHIHSRDLPESYTLVYDWRDLTDAFYLINEKEPKILLTEAYTSTLDQTIAWYGNGSRLGSEVAFDFKLIVNVDASSGAKKYADEIKEWLDYTPDYGTPNWVLGNHDNSRVSARFGADRVEQMAILQILLPGVVVIYYGEEIGMTDNTGLSWEETLDPAACNTNETAYAAVSRDPARTPFQWDDSTNAGFNEDAKPWLPITYNYRDVNLKAQMETNETSVFKLYQKLIKLRKEPAFFYGDIEITTLNEDSVLAIRRWFNEQQFITIINFSKEDQVISLPDTWEDLADHEVELVLANSGYKHDEHMSVDGVMLEANDAVVVEIKASGKDSGVGALKLTLMTLLFGLLLSITM